MEQQRNRRQHGRKNHQQDGPNCPPRERGDCGNRQCLARLTLARHGIAIKAGRDSARNTRRVQQNRGCRAAKNRPIIDTCQ